MPLKEVLLRSLSFHVLLLLLMFSQMHERFREDIICLCIYISFITCTDMFLFIHNLYTAWTIHLKCYIIPSIIHNTPFTCLNFHLPRQLQSTMLPASPHSASLHMKIYPACNGSVIIVDYTSIPYFRSVYKKSCTDRKKHITDI